MKFSKSQLSAMLYFAAIAILLMGGENLASLIYPTEPYDFSAFETEFRMQKQQISQSTIETGDSLFADSTNTPYTQPLLPQQQPKSSKTSRNKKAIGKVNINTATLAELETLPRIGPVIAARIIAYRTEIGNFSNIEELKSVKGIGAKTFNNLRHLIDVK